MSGNWLTNFFVVKILELHPDECRGLVVTLGKQPCAGSGCFSRVNISIDQPSLERFCALELLVIHIRSFFVMLMFTLSWLLLSQRR
jgi:hypothetical protein